MIIYKKGKSGGFAVGSNKLTDESLAAGGIAAAFAIILNSIFRNKRKAAKKNKKRSFLGLILFPFAYKAAKYAVSQAKLSSLVNKVKQGEDISDSSFSEHIFSGIEVIEAEPVSSEDEVYRICEE